MPGDVLVFSERFALSLYEYLSECEHKLNFQIAVASAVSVFSIPTAFRLLIGT